MSTGRAGSAATTAAAATRSPVRTGGRDTASASGVRSSPRSRARAVSAVARRSRWSSVSFSRPSSPGANSSLPRSTAGTDSRSTGRAVGRGSPVIAARRRAAAAMVSAAATANRADTPEPWSTAVDSRSSRVNRARISSRGIGTGGGEVGLLAG